MHTLTLLALVFSAHAYDIGDFIRYMTNSWEFAQRDFNTSYSPCLDALIVNFKSSGCEVIAQDPERLGKGSVGLVCTSPVVENGYTRNEHVIFYTPKHDMQDFSGWDMFCVDPHITMYIPEPSKARRAK